MLTKFYKLDAEEQELLDWIEKGEEIVLHVTKKDVLKAKKKALKVGLPWEDFLSGILHKHLADG